jgi:hypothetical protein
MMNYIGTDDFAVEFDLDPRTDNPEMDSWLYGHLRFVVGGRPVGDGARSVSLNDGTVGIAGLIANRGRRSNPQLLKQSTDAIFHTLFGALYKDTGQSDEQVNRDWAMYAVLLGIPKGFESFDGWQAFLVEDSSQARYVWRQMSDASSPIHEQALRPGQFDEVLETFMKEMRRLAPNVVK